MSRGTHDSGDGRGLALAVLAYRSMMAQFSGDADSGARLWEMAAAAAPPGAARALYGGFFAFARALLVIAERPLEWRPNECPHLCRDEWLAMRMIDSAQRGDPAGLLAAAAKLAGPDALGDALNATQSLALLLARQGVFVCPQSRGLTCDLCPHRTLH